MADILIRLRFNLETGKKDILIDYEGDEDSLPFEHEKRHRQIVQHLLGEGVLKPDEVGNVVVQRGGTAQSVEEDQGTPTRPQANKVGDAG